MGTPSSLARTSRNASLELPSVNTTRASRYSRKLRSNGLSVNLELLVARFGRGCLVRPRTNSPTTISPGTNVSKNSILSSPGQNHRNAAAKHRTDGGPQMIHRPVEAECTASHVGSRGVGDQGISGRCADALADSVSSAGKEQLPRSGDHANEADGRQPPERSRRRRSPSVWRPDPTTPPTRV